MPPPPPPPGPPPPPPPPGPPPPSGPPPTFSVKSINKPAGRGGLLGAIAAGKQLKKPKPIKNDFNCDADRAVQIRESDIRCILRNELYEKDGCKPVGSLDEMSEHKKDDLKTLIDCWGFNNEQLFNKIRSFTFFQENEAKFYSGDFDENFVQNLLKGIPIKDYTDKYKTNRPSVMRDLKSFIVNDDSRIVYSKFYDNISTEKNKEILTAADNMSTSCTSMTDLYNESYWADVQTIPPYDMSFTDRTKYRIGRLLKQFPKLRDKVKITSIIDPSSELVYKGPVHKNVIMRDKIARGIQEKLIQDNTLDISSFNINCIPDPTETDGFKRLVTQIAINVVNELSTYISRYGTGGDHCVEVLSSISNKTKTTGNKAFLSLLGDIRSKSNKDFPYLLNLFRQDNGDFLRLSMCHMPYVRYSIQVNIEINMMNSLINTIKKKLVSTKEYKEQLAKFLIIEPRRLAVEFKSKFFSTISFEDGEMDQLIALFSEGSDPQWELDIDEYKKRKTKKFILDFATKIKRSGLKRNKLKNEFTANLIQKELSKQIESYIQSTTEKVASTLGFLDDMTKKIDIIKTTTLPALIKQTSDYLSNLPNDHREYNIRKKYLEELKKRSPADHFLTESWLDKWRFDMIKDYPVTKFNLDSDAWLPPIEKSGKSNNEKTNSCVDMVSKSEYESLKDQIRVLKKIIETSNIPPLSLQQQTLISASVPTSGPTSGPRPSVPPTTRIVTTRRDENKLIKRTKKQKSVVDKLKRTPKDTTIDKVWENVTYGKKYNRKKLDIIYNYIQRLNPTSGNIQFNILDSMLKDINMRVIDRLKLIDTTK